jgi:peroxiredoxin
VVLFLDPNCEGCSEMAARWDRGVSEGIVEPERIFAVTSATAAVNSQYRNSHALSFPLYQDVEDAFLQRYGVVTYPMEVVVGASGTIQSLSSDSKTPIDAESIRALIEK